MTSLEIKLASMVSHLVEFSSEDGDICDLQAARSVMQDSEVVTILTPGALIPVLRSGKSVVESLNESPVGS